jgi:teichuronic acid exporter
MTLKNTILGNLRWMLFAKLGCQLVTWISTLFVMRILRPEDYGLIAMATILVSLLTMINEMGLGSALVQAEEITEYKTRQCFGLIILVNVGSYIALCALAPVAAWFFQEEKLTIMIPVIGIQFLIQIFLVIPSALLDRSLRFRERAIYEITTSIIGAIASLLMAVAGLGVWAIIFGNLCMATLYVVALNLKFPFVHRPVFRLAGIYDIAKYGFLTVLNRLLWYFYSQADALLVGRLLGSTVLGFYSVGVQIASLPLIKVSSIFNQLALAGFSSMRSDQKRIGEGVIVIARVASFISVPIFWGIASVASEFVHLILGDKWEPAILPLQCIALILPLRVLSIALAQAVNAVGRPDMNVVNLAVACVVMPAAFAIGIHYWGLKGVCLAWIITYPAWIFYALQQGLPKLGLDTWHYLKNIAPPYLIGAIMFMIIWLARDFLPFDHWAKFFFLILIGSITYPVLIWVFAKEYAVRAISDLRRDEA